MARIITLENRIEQLERDIGEQTKTIEKVVNVLGDALGLADAMQPKQPQAKKTRGTKK